MSSAKDISEERQTQCPPLSIQTVESLLSKLYGLTTSSIESLDGYIDRNFHVKVNREHSNCNLDQVCPDGYVFKVYNEADSRKPQVEAELAIQQYLSDAGISCPLPVPSTDGELYQLIQLQDFMDVQDSSVSSKTIHQVRLLTFLPGETLSNMGHMITSDLLAQVGVFLGKVQNTLQDFTHPHLSDGHELWALNNTYKLTNFLSAVTDHARYSMVEEIINCFSVEVMGNTAKLSQGTIHGDFGCSNIIVGPNEASQGKSNLAIVDFGHVSRNFHVFELGIAIMYLSNCWKVEPLMTGGYILSGYLEERSLNQDEWRALKLCVCVRYAQSLLIGAHTAQKDPENKYILKTSLRGWEELERMWKTPNDVLYKRWCDIVRDRGTSAELPY